MHLCNYPCLCVCVCERLCVTQITADFSVRSHQWRGVAKTLTATSLSHSYSILYTHTPRTIQVPEVTIVNVLYDDVY